MNIKKLPRIVLIIASMVSLVSCVTTGSNLLGIDKPVLPYLPREQAHNFSEKAYVIFSTSTAGPEWPGPAYLFMRSSDKKLDGILRMWSDDVALANYFSQKSINETIPLTGLVHVLAVEPGEYEMYHYYGNAGKRYYSSSNDFDFNFDIGRGEIKYLGNIHFGFSKDLIYQIRIQDYYNTDLEIVKKIYPGITGKTITKEIVSFKKN